MAGERDDSRAEFSLVDGLYFLVFGDYSVVLGVKLYVEQSSPSLLHAIFLSVQLELDLLLPKRTQVKLRACRPKMITYAWFNHLCL